VSEGQPTLVAVGSLALRLSEREQQLFFPRIGSAEQVNTTGFCSIEYVDITGLHLLRNWKSALAR